MGTKVKICGITDPEDARLAVELGAWALGLNFWPQSVRDAARRTRPRRSRPTFRRGVELAGVFVNATLDEVAVAADRYELTPDPAARRRGTGVLP